MLDKIAAHRYLYQFLKDKVTLFEIEQWFYTHQELEDIFGEHEYYQFIARDYKNKYAYEDTQKQIKPLLENIGFYEQERIETSINELIVSSKEYLGILDSLYDDYCDGYFFLRYIAFVYVTTSDEYKEVINQDPIEMQKYREKINQEAKRILGFLENKLLIIENEHEYIDLREEKDRIEMHSINKMMNE